MSKKTRKIRIETDSMGDMEVPAIALYGATTQRAVLNFPISGRKLPSSLIAAFALLKQSAAIANHRLKNLDASRCDLITDACDEVLNALMDPVREAGMMRHFPIDVFQTGSGTSTNMNMNEVISNIACKIAGKKIGAKDPVHPNDHVNMGQSSNDTFPTAMQIAACVEIRTQLVPAMKMLHKSIKAKAKKWDKIVTVGRTHLMDATPIRMGQIFSGYAASIEYAIKRANRAMTHLAGNMPIGGTAVGTGMNTHPKFGTYVCRELSKATKIKFIEANVSGSNISNVLIGLGLPWTIKTIFIGRHEPSTDNLTVPLIFLIFVLIFTIAAFAYNNFMLTSCFGFQLIFIYLTYVVVEGLNIYIFEWNI